VHNEDFKELVWQKGRELYRPMPWRSDTRPYYVLVSELMLQQTQVARVIPKFQSFINAFPNEVELAGASLADVLKQWQGLGYNRRAKYLHDAAKMIQHDFEGTFPTAYKDIIRLPGVGKNTTGAILAYSFNQPSIFIETNIRTVYIHHFFNDHFDVDDKQITQKLEQTIDKQDPRGFYWSLMDYGSWLKANGMRNISRSKHYKKQSKLEGSVRQVRGAIIRELGNQTYARETLRKALGADNRFDPALEGLLRDGLVSESAGKSHLTK